jgi:hypothetical protein
MAKTIGSCSGERLDCCMAFPDVSSGIASSSYLNIKMRCLPVGTKTISSRKAIGAKTVPSMRVTAYGPHTKHVPCNYSSADGNA